VDSARDRANPSGLDTPLPNPADPSAPQDAPDESVAAEILPAALPRAVDHDAFVSGDATNPAPGAVVPNDGMPVLAGQLVPRMMPAPKPPLLRPRKVRGGVRLEREVSELVGWAAQRWLRIVEAAASGDVQKEALTAYAETGQTRRIAYLPGRIEAAVQGRADRAYTTMLRVVPFSPEHWDRVVEGLSEGAVYAAKLLAGEMPSNIEEVFAPLGLKLFPMETADISVSCSCNDFRDKEAAALAAVRSEGSTDPLPDASPATEPKREFWCKHIVCVAYLFAERLSIEPFLMFVLRGVEGQDLLDRLRQRRAVTGAALGATPVYTQRVPGVSDREPKALDADLDHFWQAGPELTMIDMPIEPPAVSHPLLRRLGPSPFTSAAFPLVGLLASCYEAISEDAIRGGPLGLTGADDEVEE